MLTTWLWFSSQKDAQCELDQASELLAICPKVARMPGGGA
jgi:hypothetical protein